MPLHESPSARAPIEEPPTVEDRLSRLMRRRAQPDQYQEELAATMDAWSNHSGEEPFLDEEDA